MSQPTEALFDPAVRVDDETLAGALFLHARAVEDCLRLTRKANVDGYTAAEVLLIAATLMSAAEASQGSSGYRWRLPAAPAPSPLTVLPRKVRKQDDDLPF
jgi:hypothetical protein